MEGPNEQEAKEEEEEEEKEEEEEEEEEEEVLIWRNKIDGGEMLREWNEERMRRCGRKIKTSTGRKGWEGTR